jgi:hypothetical protein
VNLLDSLYLDLDSNLVCGNIVLLPYTSKVLINTMTLCNPIGLADPAMPRVVVFPNPTADVFTMRVAADWVGASYRLVNALGQPVLEGRMRGLEQEFGLQDLPSGMYLLEVEGRGRAVVRVMKN